MGEYLVVDDVTRIRCQRYSGKFHLWLLMTFCVVQPETLINFRLVLCTVAVRAASESCLCCAMLCIAEIRLSLFSH